MKYYKIAGNYYRGTSERILQVFSHGIGWGFTHRISVCDLRLRYGNIFSEVTEDEVASIIMLDELNK